MWEIKGQVLDLSPLIPRALELICDLVEQSAGRAALVDLESIAERAELPPAGGPG